MAKFLIYILRILNLYLYFVVGAGLLSLVPNINPNYPLFHYIFKFAGFYLIPPVFGVSFSPMAVLVFTALISMGLVKLYDKYYASKEPKVIVVSPEEFIRKMAQFEKIKNKDDETSSDNQEDKDL
jgi:uncharacterized protein YggT (Ycf19 family)